MLFETTALAMAPERHGSQAAGEQTASDPLDHTPTDPRPSHILSGLARKFAPVLAGRIRSLSENASTSSVPTETPACRPKRAPQAIDPVRSVRYLRSFALQLGTQIGFGT